MTGQISGAHSFRGPTKARKRSKVNWKNINKTPNPVKQEKAEQKRAKRRERNLDNQDRILRSKSYASKTMTFQDIWLYGMPSVRSRDI